MKLVNLLALIDGTLLTKPFVENFENITTSSKKVKRGDLFLALKHEDIETAVQNGAYAIIFDKSTQISDNEIAWIKVDSLEKSLIKILRYIILEKELNYYSCDQITIALASQISTENVIILDQNIYDDSEKILSAEQKSILLYSKKSIDQNIFISSKELSEFCEHKIFVMEKTLFESSFIFNDIFYERQLISPFFLIYLEKLLNLYLSLNIEYKIRLFKDINHFKPIFITNTLEVKEFGLTQKVLIFEPDFSLFNELLLFLESEASWANMIYIIPSKYEKSVIFKENIFTYNDDKDIIITLKQVSFNFALIFETDESILDTNHQSSYNVQLTLNL